MFSGRTRGFCPSCHARRLEEWGNGCGRRFSCHIPDKGQVTVGCYGLYANAHRGKVRKADRAPVSLGMIEEESPRVPSKGWAEIIRKLYQVDPMICPRYSVTWG